NTDVLQGSSTTVVNLVSSANLVGLTPSEALAKVIQLLRDAEAWKTLAAALPKTSLPGLALSATEKFASQTISADEASALEKSANDTFIANSGLDNKSELAKRYAEFVKAEKIKGL